MGWKAFVLMAAQGSTWEGGCRGLELPTLRSLLNRTYCEQHFVQLLSHFYSEAKFRFDSGYMHVHAKVFKQAALAAECAVKEL